MIPFKEIATLPRRLFAIGDIHGCAAETEALLDYLQGEQKLSDQDLVIFIGDYIDRGPDSRQVVDLMLKFKRAYPRSIFLKGNHEDMLLGFLGYEGTAGVAYLQNGGALTLKSYGIEGTDTPEMVRRKISPVHIEFFRTLDTYVVVAGYVFVHAGLSPVRDVRDQKYEDIYWIRDEFINNVHRFDKTVVFGHTPFVDVLFHLPYKIGIDTGLVYGNKLTCIELSERQVLQVEKGESVVTLSTFDEHIKRMEIP